MKLYEINSRYQAVMDAIEEAGGELDDTLAAELNAVEDELAVKVENICKLVRNLTAEEEAFKAEADRLRDKARAKSNAVERIKEFLKVNLETMGIEKTESADGLFKVAIQKNSQPAIMWRGLPESIPADLRKAPPPPELDKKAVLDGFKAGNIKPSDMLSIEYGTHLRIR